VEEDKFIEEDFSVDWVSPLIYDIHPNEEDLINGVSFVVDAIKFIKEKNSYHVFDESPHNEGFQLSNEEIMISLELKIFYQILLVIIWMLISACWMTILIFVVKKELIIL